MTGAVPFVPSYGQVCAWFGVPALVLRQHLKARHEFATQHPEMVAENGKAGNGHGNSVAAAIPPPRKHHPHRDGAKQPIGRLHGGDLRFKCTRCDRPIVPFDIVLDEGDVITIDCTCGVRSQIWMTPQMWRQ